MTGTSDRLDHFTVSDDHLVRSVVPARGTPYEHRCPLASVEKVSHAIDEASGDGFTLETLVAYEDLPFTRVAVALAFMKERGCGTTRNRRNYAATDCVHLGAMTEYHALAENG